MCRFTSRVGLLSLAAVVVAAVPVAAQEATTTRIEPRVFYGATVTLEEGVRVFRALPPHKHVIINPDSKAPVSLSYNETVEKSYNYYEMNGQLAPSAGVLPFGGAALPYGYIRSGHGNAPAKPRMHGLSVTR